MSRSTEAKLVCEFCEEQQEKPIVVPQPYTGVERRRQPRAQVDPDALHARLVETGLTGPVPEK